MPDGLNVFSWSLPFLADKVSSMLYTIVKKCSNFDDEPDEKEALNKLESDQAEQSRKAKNVIKGKIKEAEAALFLEKLLRGERLKDYGHVVQHKTWQLLDFTNTFAMLASN